MSNAKMIYKYDLRKVTKQAIEMPDDSQILNIQIQAGIPCVWTLGTPGVPYVRRIITCVGTGHSIHNELDVYIGTVQVESMVLHFFEGGIE